MGQERCRLNLGPGHSAIGDSGCNVTGMFMDETCQTPRATVPRRTLAARRPG
jgi:hypothetical protein